MNAVPTEVALTALMLRMQLQAVVLTPDEINGVEGWACLIQFDTLAGATNVEVIPPDKVDARISALEGRKN